MIYAILKILSRLTIWGYFRKVKIVGRENIPKDGPIIFVANHPSAFMDPIVVATSVKPAVHFIAAGEYVGTGVKGWLFQKLFHSIPVYRPSTRPEDAHKNKDMFVKCHEHLGKEGILVVFPEGLSLTEKKLKPLKTGTVRIVIGAEKLNDYQLNIPIIPVGLNYSDPHSFRSDLFVKIGSPIYVNDFLNDTNKTDKDELFKVTHEITEILQKEMQKTVLHIESENNEATLAKLEAIFYRDVKAKYNVGYKDQEAEFTIQKDFIDGIVFFQKKNPTLFAKTEEKLDVYLELLNKNGITDKDISDFRNRYEFKRVFSFIVGFPIFLFGLIHNYLPYRMVSIFTRKIKLNENFTGSMLLAIGMVLFLIWYIGISILFGKLLLGWYAIFYPVLMYVSGLYALLYNTAIKESFQRKNLRELTKNNRSILSELMTKRQEIMEVVTNWQKEYLDKK